MALMIIDTRLRVSQSTALHQAAPQTLASVWGNGPTVPEELWR
jgi:hypothetical protein